MGILSSRFQTVTFSDFLSVYSNSRCLHVTMNTDKYRSSVSVGRKCQVCFLLALRIKRLLHQTLPPLLLLLLLRDGTL